VGSGKAGCVGRCMYQPWGELKRRNAAWPGSKICEMADYVREGEGERLGAACGAASRRRRTRSAGAL